MSESTNPGKKSALIIGFSVTEDKKGYIKHLTELANKKPEPFDIEIRAMGGETMRLVPFIFDQIVTKKYDYIAFEIATSRRFFDDPERYMKLLSEIAYKCRQVGSTPAFINLYRDDVDYVTDKMTVVIADFCRQYGYPLLNMVENFLDLKHSEDLWLYVRDGVHLTDMGSQLVAGKVVDFLYDCLNKDMSWDRPTFVSAPALVPGTPPKTFSRGDITLPILEVRENETIKLVLPEPGYVMGLLFMIHPLGGEFLLEADTRKRPLRCFGYDRNAYYSRFSSLMFEPFFANELTVTSLPGRPNIKLSKGDPNEEPRVNSIAGIFTNWRLTRIFT